MNKGAKEFRIKKPVSASDKSNSMKLPECPLPTNPNPKLLPNTVHANGPSMSTGGVFHGTQPFFDKEGFQKEFVSGNSDCPPQVINFFMNNDINQLSAQFMAAFQRGPQGTVAHQGKQRQRKSKEKLTPNKPKQDHLTLEKREEGKQTRVNKQHSAQNSDSRRSSNKSGSNHSKGSRNSSRHSSKGKKHYRHHSMQKFTNKVKKGSSKSGMSQFSHKEKEVLYANKLKLNHGVARPRNLHIPSSEYYCTAGYKIAPTELPKINPTEFPPRPFKAFENAARELNAFKLFSEAGEPHFT